MATICTFTGLSKILGAAEYYDFCVDMNDLPSVKAVFGEPPLGSIYNPLPEPTQPEPPRLAATVGQPVRAGLRQFFAELARYIADRLDGTLEPQGAARVAPACEGAEEPPPRFTPFVATTEGRLTPAAQARRFAND
jgi:hypothetical protein